MNKRLRSILSCLLAAVLLAGMLPMTAAAASTPFSDVADTDWFANPVLWAVEEGITSGISPTQFGPNNPCTRAQVVTFLWAAEGKPEPGSTNNPFTDVPNDAWYAKPVLWAVERGITGGTSETTFSPDQQCTRAQIVTFLYAAAGKPNVDTSSGEFSDVSASDWFVKPVLWAKANDITGGTGPNTFGPNNICTRGQVVTFLFKAYDGSVPEVTPEPTPEVTPTPELPADREPSLTMPSELTLEIGQSETIQVLVDLGSYVGDYFVVYNVQSGSNAAGIQWGNTTDTYRELNVTGYNPGTTVFSIAMSDAGGNMMDQIFLTVTVTGEPTTREGQAYKAMKEWIVANHTYVDGDTYTYSEVLTDADGQIEYALSYTLGASFIELEAWTDVIVEGIPAYFDTYVTMEEGLPVSPTGIYFFLGEYSEAGLLFEGHTQIVDAEFCQITEPYFNQAYGDTANSMAYLEYLKYSNLSALIFADEVFKQYIPGGYTIADLGYTNIYN